MALFWEQIIWRPWRVLQAWEWPTVPASTSFIKALESHVSKELCGQPVTERFDPLRATSSGLKVSGRNDCKRFIQNPCLEILQVTYWRPLMLQEPCGRGMTSSQKSYQRPKFQPKPGSPICCVTLGKPLLALCSRNLNMQNVAWAPWSLWCLSILNLDMQCSCQSTLLPVAVPTDRRMVSWADRVLVTLISGGPGEKATANVEGLESELPFDFRKGPAKNPAAPSKVVACLARCK